MTPEAPRPCVIVGYDGSTAARVALKQARRLAGEAGLVVVVHAFGLPGDWLGWPNYDRALRDHQARGRELLADLGLDPDAAAPVDGLEAELLGGRPAEALADVARARDADFIVVGSHGYGSVRAVLGSVSHQLLHLADRPVVVIPQTYANGDSSALSRR